MVIVTIEITVNITTPLPDEPDLFVSVRIDGPYVRDVKQSPSRCLPIALLNEKSH